jgi:hypothetical protein
MPEGMTIGAIAERNAAFAPELPGATSRRWNRSALPVWEKGNLRGILEDHFLPPISFTLPEAMTVFLAARLMLAYSNTYNPNIDSTFVKLNSAVPAPLQDQVSRTIEWMQKLNRDDRLRRTTDLLTQAWTQGHKARITYQALGAQRRRPCDRTLFSYSPQPSSTQLRNKPSAARPAGFAPSRSTASRYRTAGRALLHYDGLRRQ